MKRFCILAFASVLSIAVAPVNRASAAEPGQHRWGSETMPNAGVCFFRDPDFRGEYFCVPASESVPRLPGDMNDKISSFRIIGAVDVMVFQNEKFKGASGRFFTDVRDLRRDGWNDRISSVRVATVTSRWDGARFPRWGREDRPREGACFYKNVDFRGDYFCVARGASYQTVPPGFNDEISSVRIMSAGGVIITSDVDFRGKTTRLTSDVKDLRRGSWNDRISSLRVY